jgi:hypothetical protein
MGANVKEFLDRFRVSSVALCNGWKIDTIFIKIDNSNFHLVPGRSAIRNYLDEHHHRLVQVLCEQSRSDEETLIFTYPYQE